MKHFVLMLALVGLVGCGHAKVVSWEDQDFVVCANRWCDKDCFTEVVNNACSAGWQVKGGFSSSTVTGASFSGNGMTLNRVSHSCSKLHCMGPLFRAPSSTQ